MAMQTPPTELGWIAHDFNVLGIDDTRYSLADVRGTKATLVMFICNHCPYVRAIITRLVADVRDLSSYGVGAVAIMPNDTDAYPDDSFDNMKVFARNNNFSFPYILDETQQIAQAYDAVCTPDFFGFDRDLKLQYRGRLDSAGMKPADNRKRELFDAMVQITQTGRVMTEQYPSIGCSIKWRAAA